MAKLRSKITQLFGKTQPNFRKTQVKIANFCKTWIKIGQKHDPNFGFTKYGFAKTQVKVIKTQLCEFRQEVPNLDSCTNKKPGVQPHSRSRRQSPEHFISLTGTTSSVRKKNKKSFDYVLCVTSSLVFFPERSKKYKKASIFWAY